MEFEKLQEIIADVLNVDPNEVTMQMIWERIPWMYFRL